MHDHYNRIIAPGRSRTIMSRMHPGTPPSRRNPDPDAWRARARQAASFLVDGLGRAGNTPAEVRRKVIAAAREALSAVTGRGMYRPAPVTAPGAGLQPDYLVSSAGVFHLPLAEFRVDWSDPMTQESFMAEVVAVLDALSSE
jgi:hypothetical protein